MVAECDELKKSLRNAGSSLAKSSKSTEELVNSLELELTIVKNELKMAKDMKVESEKQRQELEVRFAQECLRMSEIERSKVDIEETLNTTISQLTDNDRKCKRLENEVKSVSISLRQDDLIQGGNAAESRY